MEEIVQRTASAMVAEGMPFQGALFAGLMIKDGNVRPFLQQKLYLILGHCFNIHNIEQTQVSG